MINKEIFYIKLKSLNKADLQEIFNLLYEDEITEDAIPDFTTKFTCKAVERRFTGYSRAPLSNKDMFNIYSTYPNQDIEHVGNIRNIEFRMHHPLSDYQINYLKLAFNQHLDWDMYKYFNEFHHVYYQS